MSAPKVTRSSHVSSKRDVERQEALRNTAFAPQYCRLRFGWLWGSIAFASRGGQNETIIADRVSHFALTTQGILPKFVRGVTFVGSTIDERCAWRWIPTTNQNVNGSMLTLPARREGAGSTYHQQPIALRAGVEIYSTCILLHLLFGVTLCPLSLTCTLQGIRTLCRPTPGWSMQDYMRCMGGKEMVCPTKHHFIAWPAGSLCSVPPYQMPE
jgi:hypothetical protein